MAHIVPPTPLSYAAVQIDGSPVRRPPYSLPLIGRVEIDTNQIGLFFDKSFVARKFKDPLFIRNETVQITDFLHDPKAAVFGRDYCAAVSISLVRWLGMLGDKYPSANCLPINLSLAFAIGILDNYSTHKRLKVKSGSPSICVSPPLSVSQRLVAQLVERFFRESRCQPTATRRLTILHRNDELKDP